MTDFVSLETMQVERLGISPLKSGRFYSDHAGFDFDPTGYFGDRDYMFVEAEPHTNVKYHKGEVAQPGHFLSQREDPVLAQVIAVPELFGLELSYNGSRHSVPEPITNDECLTNVSVWGWEGVAVDQGDEVAEWGREVFGRAVRLVKASQWHPRHVEGNTALGTVGFSDGYPLLVTSIGSVNAVNEQLASAGKEPVTGATFRPNIILDCDIAFVEDHIDSFTFETDGLIWRAVRRKPCGRCVIVDKNPETGETKPGVQKALTTLGRKGTYTNPQFGNEEKVFFGQNFIISPPQEANYATAGTLLKGDTVSVTMDAQTNWVKT